MTRVGIARGISLRIYLSLWGQHIGMFVTWCLLNQLFDEEAVAEMREETERLERKEITPGVFLMEVLDGKFVSDDLTDTGNAFCPCLL